jgi:hypothetical protein
MDQVRLAGQCARAVEDQVAAFAHPLTEWADHRCEYEHPVTSLPRGVGQLFSGSLGAAALRQQDIGQ